MNTNDELKNETANGTNPVLGEVSFTVATYTLLGNDLKYCHWGEGLNMIIEKNDITMKLNGEEIQEIVKSLQGVIGLRY